MSEKIPIEIRHLLDDFIRQINIEKPNLLHGVYLYGSLALGAYISQKSDVDFIALLTRQCTVDDLSVLENAHKFISQKYPKIQLDGSYLQEKDLGKLNDDLAPYPHFDNQFNRAGHYDVNLITWWTLKHHGICVYGDALNTEAITVNWQALIDAMHVNLNSYWQDWASNPEKHQLLILDGAIEWAVLGVLRQYYSFKEDSITSKIGAGDYALIHLPETWHTLVKDALLIRNNGTSLYHDKLQRQTHAIEFLEFIIQQSNDIYHSR